MADLTEDEKRAQREQQQEQIRSLIRDQQIAAERLASQKAGDKEKPHVSEGYRPPVWDPQQRQGDGWIIHGDQDIRLRGRLDDKDLKPKDIERELRRDGIGQGTTESWKAANGQATADVPQGERL